jgi:hypothetical protein
MNVYSTKDVAELLNLPVHCLSQAVWRNKVEAPAKGPGGAYMWSLDDIERASWALRRKSADDIFESLGAA